MTEQQQNRYMEQSQIEHERFDVRMLPDGLSRDVFAKETLMRYANCDISDFQRFILLTNFPDYVRCFCKHEATEMIEGSVLNVAHSKQSETTIIDYQLGAPMGALIMDLISYTHPQCVIMLGLCGGIHISNKVGDFLLPMAAIRDEGVSRHYMPAQVPSLPAFLVQQHISETLIKKNISFKTGVIHTTDYRMWEYDQEFIKKLREEKATAIDMECSALFTAGFKRKVPVGALMLVSDLPLQPGGKKTKALSDSVFKQYRNLHVTCGIEAVAHIRSVIKARAINFRRFQF